MTAPVVTAHAVVRYLERALEFDVEALRAESGLHRDDDVGLVAWLGDVKWFPIQGIRRQITEYVTPVLGMGVHRLPFDGIVLCLEGAVVKTVLPGNGMNRHWRARAGRRHPQDFREVAQ